MGRDFRHIANITVALLLQTNSMPGMAIAVAHQLSGLALLPRNNLAKAM